MTQKRKVVVTGMGAIHALGNTVPALWANVLAGKSGVRAMPEWEATLPGQIASPLALDPAAVKAIDRKKRRSMGPLALYAALAADEAVRQSGLTPEELGSGRCGCMVGSTIGSGSELTESLDTWLHGNRETISAMMFFKIASNTTAFNVANAFGIKGVQMSPCAACASGSQAIGAALECIQLGKQEMMLAGGADELTPLVNGTFAQLFALADPAAERFTPAATSRPFDKRRVGLVCGEGAGMLVLEEYEHAKARGANILFEIAGYCTNCSGIHLSQSDAGAIARCVRGALEDAALDPSQIGYVSAHATSTRQGDSEEAKGLAEVFGDRVSVSSLKGNLGHTLGASGPLELILSYEMMARGVLLPTLNLEEVDPECACIRHVQKPTPATFDAFVKNSFAFGGINAVLVAKKFKGESR